MSSVFPYTHEVQPTLVWISDNNTWVWEAEIRGHSRISDRNGIKTTANRPTLVGDERTNCSRHKHLV